MGANEVSRHQESGSRTLNGRQENGTFAFFSLSVYCNPLLFGHTPPVEVKINPILETEKILFTPSH